MFRTILVMQRSSPLSSNSFSELIKMIYNLQLISLNGYLFYAVIAACLKWGKCILRYVNHPWSNQLPSVSALNELPELKHWTRYLKLEYLLSLIAQIFTTFKLKSRWLEPYLFANFLRIFSFVGTFCKDPNSLIKPAPLFLLLRLFKSQACCWLSVPLMVLHFSPN